jgi:hypothetical protein
MYEKINIKKTKKTKKIDEIKNEKQYSLKKSKFNPINKSPNLFISNLQFRINNYCNELMENDFKLDTK